MYSQEEIDQLLKSALYLLIDRDRELLEIDVNERTLSHRLAVYLEGLFLGWNVDCEYNRLNDRVKRTHYERCQYLAENITTVDDTKGKTVYPDIIVHRRRTTNNLLVVEMKCSSSSVPDECDIVKLQSYKTDLGYDFAAFVKLKTDTSINEPFTIRWI